ncbi:putative lipoprotein [Myxococcus hansupus]|uniref:Putative lipoprotein n=1 Tax=Pseudomyxococcus hansupus TaxID=1297742 RepID=A0A0H4WWY7_9BACT|nr:hypothetical protein [Myxococcus hansupus]AKQ67916.1 putative lipoprotein [Myxococcus hansupus]
MDSNHLRLLFTRTLRALPVADSLQAVPLECVLGGAAFEALTPAKDLRNASQLSGHDLSRLREELTFHGAEVTHQGAALVSALEDVLRGVGGEEPSAPQVESLAPRSLFAVALDNAADGCVRETFGALVAQHQALHARDGEVRAFMARIAEDETRRAELSWKVDRWVQDRLSDAERDVLRLVKQRASEALRAEAAVPLHPVLVSEAGLPAPEVAVELVDSLARELWA